MIGRCPCGLTTGTYASIGSSGPITPRSTSCRAATPVYGLQSDPVGPTVSTVIGRPVARSATPYARASATSVPAPTAIDNPGVPQCSMISGTYVSSASPSVLMSMCQRSH